MKIKFILYFSLLISYSNICKAQNVVIIIIDGARYTEIFGDPEANYIPKMKELSKQGTYLSNFQNNRFTYTSRAVPALWCGDWVSTPEITYQGSNTQYTSAPSIFEYFRKQKNEPAENCQYVLKYVSSLWLQSFRDDYGPDYWPKTISEGSTDTDVYNNAIEIMENEHPQLLWIYLADVDHEGHSGIWENYVNSIKIADDIVDKVWSKIQSDPFYKDNTVMLVTNDHGRHDDEHGGFSGHGCSCDGCRHIMFLALGPNIKQNYSSDEYHILPDFAVTASHILSVNPEYATGEVIPEIFEEYVVNIENVKEQNDILIYPNPCTNHIYINFNQQLPNSKIEIYNILGKKIFSEQNIRFPYSFIAEKLNKGTYIIRIKSKNYSFSKRLIKQ